MSMHDVQAIILAAGRSTRFRTGKTKLLEKICGQEMVLYATKLCQQMQLDTTLVVGYQKEEVIKKVTEACGDTLEFVTQVEQQGTGHAILKTQDTWKKDNILICNGDAPLVTRDIIDELYGTHQKTNADISFVVAHNADPSLKGYGRLVKKADQIKIVESIDYDGDVSVDCCINAGIYIIKKEFLDQFISHLNSNNNSNEFYLTDMIAVASNAGKIITTVTAPFDAVRGVNTFKELWVAEQIKRSELIRYWMHRGVQFTVAQNVHIDLTVSIGAGTRIGCGVHLLGKTTIGDHCDIDEFSSVENSIIDDNVVIRSHCIIKDAYVEADVAVGPFAYIHDKAHISANSKIGSFVDIQQEETVIQVQQNKKDEELTFSGAVSSDKLRTSVKYD